LFNQRRTANPITPCVVIANATFLDPDNRVAGEQWERQLQRLVLGRRILQGAVHASEQPSKPQRDCHHGGVGLVFEGIAHDVF
jgi:hypothetical protein